MKRAIEIAFTLLPPLYFLVVILAQSFSLLDGRLYTATSLALALFFLYGTRSGPKNERKREAGANNYILFILLLWFLTPFIRRYGDFNSEWSELNIYGLAPILASAVSAPLISRRRSDFQKFGKYFSLIFLGIAYGYTIGLIKVGLAPATYALLNWLTPILFGAYLASHYKHYPAFRFIVYRAFIIGLMVTGAYGIYQFFVLPEWDAFWISNVQMTSVGSPFPMSMRVFSTMNSPMVYAPFAAMCMIYLLPRANWLAFGIIAVTLISLALTLVRAAWFGAAVSFLIYFTLLARQQPRKSLRAVFLGFVLSSGLLAFASLIPASERLADRFLTLSALSSDTSFNERLKLYADSAANALGNITGDGLGAVGLAQFLSSDTENAVVSFDSGLLQFPMMLGWPGTILYLVGLFGLLHFALLSLKIGQDPFRFAYISVILSTILQMIFANRLVGPTGFLFYVFIGLTVSAVLYRTNGKSFVHHIACNNDTLCQRQP